MTTRHATVIVALATASGQNTPGEPAIPDQPRNKADQYSETPGAHAERPGKHSTTAGRHGTSGEVGGGTNTQSGSEAAPTDHPVRQQGD